MMMMMMIISDNMFNMFNGTSTPKGSYDDTYSAKAGVMVNCPKL